MAVVMSMHWPEASLDQYEQARKEVKWETNVPKGALFHVAFLADDGFRVIDLWESAEDFQQFSDSRLAPAIQTIGIQGQPTVTFSPVHATFNPGVALAGRTKTRKPAARRKPARPPKRAARKKAARSRAGTRKAKR